MDTFLWDRGELTDLGTLGGDNSEAYWINDAGQIVGLADLPGSQVHHAFLWQNGKMIDLGASPDWPCSTAFQINSRGQVIIETGVCFVGGGPGLLWENGHLYDLNDLIPSNSSIKINGPETGPNFISDRGEITAAGILPNGDHHAILLVPVCAEEIAAAEALSVQPRANTVQPPFSRGHSALNRFRRTRQLP